MRLLDALLVVALVLGCAFVVYLLTAFLTWQAVWRSNRHLPGPKHNIIPILGQLNDMFALGGLVEMSKAYNARYGNHVVFLGSTAYFQISDPQLMQEACMKKTRQMPHRGADYSFSIINGTYGWEFRGANQNLLSGTTDDWKAVRAGLSSIFRHDNLCRYLPQLRHAARRVATRALEGGKEGQEVNVHTLLQRMTLENILALALGISIESADDSTSGNAKGSRATTRETTVGEPLEADQGTKQHQQSLLMEALSRLFDIEVLDLPCTILTELMPEWLQPYFMVIPFQLQALVPGDARRIQNARRLVVRTALAMVNRVRQSNGQPIKYRVPDKYALGTPEDGSIIHTLANARRQDTKLPFDDVQIAYQVVTMLLAGYDTTSNSLAFALHLLAKHPAYQKRAAKECAALDTSKLTTLEEVELAMPYTYACYKEALRMYPPGYIIPRYAVADVSIGEYLVKKGNSITLNIVGMHWDERYYPQPEKYTPERFMPGNLEMEARDPNAFLPFGMGPRVCLGYRFALMQALLCLATVLPAVQFDLDENRLDKPIELNNSITLGPKYGIWLHAVPRPPHGL